MARRSCEVKERMKGGIQQLLNEISNRMCVKSHLLDFPADNYEFP